MEGVEILLGAPGNLRPDRTSGRRSLEQKREKKRPERAIGIPITRVMTRGKKGTRWQRSTVGGCGRSLWSCVVLGGDLLVQRTCVMSQFRVMTANTHGCASALLAARGISLHGERLNAAVEMASYGDALSMDMAKEALGLLQGEPAETTAGRDRARLTAELRWMYARSMEQLDLDDGSAPYLRRYASAGLHYVLLNDRYQERLMGFQRLRLTPVMDALIKSYRVGISVPLEVHERQVKGSLCAVSVFAKASKVEGLKSTEAY